MIDLKTLHSLPDRAVALYFTIREMESSDIETLQGVTGKSPASIYRGLGELRDAGFIVGKSPKPKLEPKPRNRMVFQVHSLK